MTLVKKGGRLYSLESRTLGSIIWWDWGFWFE